MKVLELLDIHRAFVPGTPVLKGLTVSVERGEVVGLLGRNGAGKTTLLRVVMGMIHPQRGTVRVFGLDPWKKPLEIKRRVGYVSEEQILPGSSRVEEVIQLHRGLFPTWDDAMERDLRERFALPARKRVRDRRVRSEIAQPSKTTRTRALRAGAKRRPRAEPACEAKPSRSKQPATTKEGTPRRTH